VPQENFLHDSLLKTAFSVAKRKPIYIYTTLKFLDLQGAAYVHDISRLRINALGNSAAKSRSQPLIFWMKISLFTACCSTCNIQTIVVRGLQYLYRQFTHCLIAAAVVGKDMDVCGYQNAVCDTWRLIIVC
jgi:hypothetical protein